MAVIQRFRSVSFPGWVSRTCRVARGCEAPAPTRTAPRWSRPGAKSAPSLTGEARAAGCRRRDQVRPSNPNSTTDATTIYTAGRPDTPSRDARAQTNDLRVGGPNDLCGRHTQIIGRYDRDASDETELTVTSTAGGIQDGAKVYKNGTHSIQAEAIDFDRATRVIDWRAGLVSITPIASRPPRAPTLGSVASIRPLPCSVPASAGDDVRSSACRGGDTAKRGYGSCAQIQAVVSYCARTLGRAGQAAAWADQISRSRIRTSVSP